MEGCSLHSSTLSSIAPSLSRAGLVAKPPRHFQTLKLHNGRDKYPHERNLRFPSVRAQSSGIRNTSSDVVDPASDKASPKDENVAFVAGATGKVGSRTVRELLKLGFRVRAGVRSAQRAETLVQSVRQMKLGAEGPQPVEMLEIVECDLEKPNQIGAALGNASVILCCIGASEKEIFDISGPYRIDYQATKNLIDAAIVAKIKHFILLTSLGTNKVGFPAAILNLFWGVLIWKRKAEEALISSGVPYTIVRPGGMERPTDAYKETHNVAFSPEDTLFGGQVSNLQVAEVLAVMAKNRILSYCKVVEVIAETTAPLTPVEELLLKIPSQRIPPKEPNVATPEIVPSKSVIQPEAPSTPVVEKEPSVVKAKETTPLSPYIAYDDLKPPTSPMPTAPTGETINVNTVDSLSTTPIPSVAESQKTRPLSPYAAYEDFKPPTSPRPTPSGSKDKPLPIPTSEDIALPSTQEKDSVKSVASDFLKSTYYLSPYHVYDDFKPPTSPSPSAPKTSPPSTSAADSVLQVPPENSAASVPPVSKPSAEQHHAEAKPTPLSPFTMYEDMKPPTSPIPSTPRKS